jgi:hypothetical protein
MLVMVYKVINLGLVQGQIVCLDNSWQLQRHTFGAVGGSVPYYKK